MNRDALLLLYVPNVPVAALLPMPYSTHPNAFSAPTVLPNPGDVLVTSTSKPHSAFVVTTVVSVPVFPNGSAIVPVPGVELRPIWKFVVRAAVAVDHQPPPWIRI